MCQILAVTLALATLLSSAQVNQPDGNVLVKEMDQQEESLVRILQNEKMWKDPKEKELLLQSLHTAKRLRPRAIVPVLLDHIDYRGTDRDTGSPLLSTEETFPACGVLIEIGISSIALILNRIKIVDPEDRSLGSRQVFNLLIYSVVEIYEQGGYGKELARQRIELEMKNTTGKQKERLTEALKYCQPRR